MMARIKFKEYLVVMIGAILSAFFFISTNSSFSFYIFSLFDVSPVDLNKEKMFMVSAASLVTPLITTTTLFFVGLGFGVRVLCITSLLAICCIAVVSAMFVEDAAYIFYLSFEYILFTVLGVFVIVRRVLSDKNKSSVKHEWPSFTLLTRDLFFVSIILFGIEQLFLYLVMSMANLTSMSFFLFTFVTDYVSWFAKMFLSLLLAQWILVKIKSNILPPLYI